MDNNTFSAIVACVIAFVIVCVFIAWLEYSNYKMINSGEYLKGYADYPDDTMFNQVATMRLDDRKIYNYCEGFLAAKHDELRKQTQDIKDKFEKHIQ